jgi:hypothetical protein
LLPTPRLQRKRLPGQNMLALRCGREDGGSAIAVVDDEAWRPNVVGGGAGDEIGIVIGQRKTERRRMVEAPDKQARLVETSIDRAAAGLFAQRRDERADSPELLGCLGQFEPLS